MRAAFTKNHLDSFIKNLIAGRESALTFKGEPKVKNVQPWDGKDKKPEVSSTDDEDLWLI